MTRLLIVDDDEDFRVTAKWLLESQGYDCEAAETAAQALELVRSTSPEAVILDIRLAPLHDSHNIVDGVELFEELKKQFGRCRVIFTSAHSDYREAFLLRRGAISFLDKDVFAQGIGGALRRAGQPRALLVDDDPVFLEIASDLLSEESINPLHISDPEKFRAEIEQWDFACFDVALIDAIFDPTPGAYQGWDLVRYIRHVAPKLPLCFLTGKENDAVRAASGFGNGGMPGTRDGLLALLSGGEAQVLDKTTPWHTNVAELLRASLGRD